MIASSVGTSMVANWNWNNLEGLPKPSTNQKKASDIVRIVWALLIKKRKWTVKCIGRCPMNSDFTHR